MTNPTGFTYTTTPYFTDVPTSHLFFAYIQKMKDLGITSGCTATTYCPGDSISNVQIATFTVRGWELRTTSTVPGQPGPSPPSGNFSYTEQPQQRRLHLPPPTNCRTSKPGFTLRNSVSTSASVALPRSNTLHIRPSGGQQHPEIGTASPHELHQGALPIVINLVSKLRFRRLFSASVANNCPIRVHLRSSAALHHNVQTFYKLH
ncbi:MAG: hypothetical protein JST93_36635 [Acidobacteria bacterium]|nr:hypothetical protein [Acidobacteriota bacterium]